MPFNDPKRTYRLDMYVLNGRYEVLLDGQRILYVPMSNTGSMAVEIAYCGVKANIRNIAYYELLTVEERKARIDPEISKPLCFGWTRLHRAVQMASPEAILQLIQLGANLNLIDDQKRTPLLLAVRAKRLEIVKLLLEKGAKVELEDNKGNNAYTLAVSLGAKDIVDYLLKAHPEFAKINVKDLKPETKPVKPPKPPEDMF